MLTDDEQTPLKTDSVYTRANTPTLESLEYDRVEIRCDNHDFWPLDSFEETVASAKSIWGTILTTEV